MYKRSTFLDQIPPVVKNLLAINIILWLATFAVPGLTNRFGFEFDLSDVLGMHYWASGKFKLTQLITYSFMHANFNHLFFNMLGLYMFGSTLEHYWGSARFMTYYLVTALGAGIVQQLFWTAEYGTLVAAINDAIAANSGKLLIPFEGELMKYFQFSGLSNFDAGRLTEMKQMLVDLPVTVGASGSIFGLLLAFGWLFPDVKIMLLFFPVPIRARVFVFIYGFVELFLGVANFSGDNVAHFAHLGGMLFGLILIFLWKKKILK